MRVLVIPDVHGRQFWRSAVDSSEYDYCVFLGDYLDPYSFEHISVEDAIDNFKDIIDFKKSNPDKVILLLGNHDMPYYSDIYLGFSIYHSRHSTIHHHTIHELFNENKDLFQIACTYDNVLFTHAGITPGWIMTVFTEQYKVTSLEDLAFSLNNLLNTDKGLQYLFMISSDRGGVDKYASCIWADVSDTMWYQNMLKDPDFDVAAATAELSLSVMRIKQVFGHTLQAFYKPDGGIGYGNAIECENCKMLDTCCAYILNTEEFTIEEIEKIYIDYD